MTNNMFFKVVPVLLFFAGLFMIFLPAFTQSTNDLEVFYVIGGMVVGTLGVLLYGEPDFIKIENDDIIDDISFNEK